MTRYYIREKESGYLPPKRFLADEFDELGRQVFHRLSTLSYGTLTLKCRLLEICTRRFIRLSLGEARRFIVGYCEKEIVELNQDDENWYGGAEIDIGADPSVVRFLVAIMRPGVEGATLYGLGVKRLDDDLFVVDTYGGDRF